jgi:hypothetical protein
MQINVGVPMIAMIGKGEGRRKVNKEEVGKKRKTRKSKGQ